MPLGTLAPQLWFQALDDTGVALPGALVYFYVTGTSTPTPAWADGNFITVLSNPAACDAAGRLVMYLNATVTYRIVITTAAGVIVRTIDPVTPTPVTIGSGTGVVGSVTGDVFVFGGDPTSPVTGVAYPLGATFDKLHAGTAVFEIDSGAMAAGTYGLQGMGLCQGGGVLTVAIVNLTDAPNTPLAEFNISTPTGAVNLSGGITFAAAGAPKQYGIKTKVSAGSAEAWGIRLRRS